MNKQSDLMVITRAKDLCSYILTITDKSPKKFRFTLTSRLQNCALNIIEFLLTANEVRVIKMDGKIDRNSLEGRRNYQQKAFTNIKMLSYLSHLAMEQQCILPKQYEQITKRLYDCQNLLGAWVKSDNKRYAEEKSS
ncbi:MAG: four helix bundle protein [Lachnospiraceae bacterium]